MHMMIDPLADPDKFTIEQCKMMGLWPPGDNMSGLLPYINRLKTADKLTIVEVGVKKGENACFILNSPVGERIGKYYGVVTDKNYEDILDENMKNEPKFTKGFDPYKKKQHVDVVLFHGDTEKLDKMLKRYYNVLCIGGIVGGNDHRKDHVKIALRDWRRDWKIGIPINVSMECWFWWKR